jgi:hypothetical protein
MSETRTTNDYYVSVHLHRYHIDNLCKTGERIEVIVRIPEEAAKILFGCRRLPEMVASGVPRSHTGNPTQNGLRSLPAAN